MKKKQRKGGDEPSEYFSENEVKELLNKDENKDEKKYKSIIQDAEILFNLAETDPSIKEMIREKILKKDEEDKKILEKIKGIEKDKFLLNNLIPKITVYIGKDESIRERIEKYKETERTQAEDKKLEETKKNIQGLDNKKTIELAQKKIAESKEVKNNNIEEANQNEVVTMSEAKMEENRKSVEESGKRTNELKAKIEEANQEDNNSYTTSGKIFSEMSKNDEIKKTNNNLKNGVKPVWLLKQAGKKKRKTKRKSKKASKKTRSRR